MIGAWTAHTTAPAEPDPIPVDPADCVDGVAVAAARLRDLISAAERVNPGVCVEFATRAPETDRLTDPDPQPALYGWTLTMYTHPDGPTPARRWTVPVLAPALPLEIVRDAPTPGPQQLSIAGSWWYWPGAVNTLTRVPDDDEPDALSDGGRVQWLSEWIDRFPANAARSADELMWVRTAKVATEYGEALDAYVMARLGVHVGRLHDVLSGVSGENPRKGKTHTVDDLTYELLDVALAALNAHEHFTGNQGVTMAALSGHIGHVYDRARSV